ncbi:VOC family protein [Bacillus sp. B1-b2]|uniref:VOC family protein n=1 Tax=Bacillus sp. B1-b2 TaxID=2653201 RepID=UPI00126272CC|nr:VOC family protein [Bacillus sp. B1-b2]KAB7669953.1 VOC family protein [Bacillus sp. B1-b2]
MIYRIGTTYLPVKNVKDSATWYRTVLGAKQNYIDESKAILELANQSIFLVRVQDSQNANFFDWDGKEHFSLTFEVNGLEALKELHEKCSNQGVHVGEIENRGHPGRNFVFSDLNGNLFDVWSELSPDYKKRYDV